MSGVKIVVRMVGSDVRQRVRHGRRAPRWAERLWIDPERCVSVAPGLDRGRRLSGQVVGGEWSVEPLETVAKIRMAVEHWRTGRTWEEVGAYDYLMAEQADLQDRDGYRTPEDIRRRFRSLDDMFGAMGRDGRLRTRAELEGRARREHRGVYMHIAGDGAPVFGNGGCHRLAAAQVLELPEIPVQLGAIHPDALTHLVALRSPGRG